MKRAFDVTHITRTRTASRGRRFAGINSVGTRSLWLFVLVSLALGCAGAPEDAASEARAALEAAKSAEADVYAPEIYRSAQDTLGMAEAEMSAQLSKFAIGRRFGHAEELFQAAKRGADRAAARAGEAREEAAAEAQRLLVQVRQTGESIDALLESDSGRRALRAPTTARGLELLSEEQEQVVSSLENIDEALRRGQESQAVQMARLARDQIESIETSIAEAVKSGRMPSLGDK